MEMVNLINITKVTRYNINCWFNMAIDLRLIAMKEYVARRRDIMIACDNFLQFCVDLGRLQIQLDRQAEEDNYYKQFIE